MQAGHLRKYMPPRWCLLTMLECTTEMPIACILSVLPAVLLLSRGLVMAVQVIP